MDPLEKMEILAKRARAERAPLVPINMNAVLRVRPQQESVAVKPMAWAAGISAVAATLVLVVTLHVSTSTTTSQSGGDSNSALFSPTQLEMP